MQHLSDQAKHAGDVVAGVTGVGAFATAVIFWLQVAALIFSILASMGSIAWFVMRYLDRQRSRA